MALVHPWVGSVSWSLMVAHHGEGCPAAHLDNRHAWGPGLGARLRWPQAETPEQDTVPWPPSLPTARLRMSELSLTGGVTETYGDPAALAPCLQPSLPSLVLGWPGACAVLTRVAGGRWGPEQ